MAFIVALDGPAGSGKGTVTKILAKKLGLVNIDTGAMYRCVALEMLNKNIELNDLEKIKDLLNSINIKLEENKNKQVVLLNGQDVSDEIRSNKVTKVVSQVSSIKEIREKLVEMQREMAKTKDIITNFLKPDNSFNNLLIAPLKSFAFVISLFGLGII